MKNELINVQNDNGELLVSARELHKGLNVSERFSSWFNRMLQYGFDENVDYVGCKVFNTLANQELQDYALKLDMAKEICMVQRSEKGKQFRKYFIECEKQLREQQTTPQVIQAPAAQLALPYDPYNRYNFKQYMINNVKMADIPEHVDKFIEAHKQDTPDERLRAYKVLKGTIEEIKSSLQTPWQIIMIQESLDKVNKLIELQKSYIIRAKSASQTKQIKKLQSKVSEYELDDFGENYYLVNKSGFTINCAYKAIENKIVCTNIYKNWQKDIAEQLDQLPEADILGFDPSKYMKLDVYFKAKEKMDVNNLIKSFVDSLADRYNFDDVNLVDIRMRKFLTFVDSFEDGQIIFAMKNLEQVEIDALT